MHSIETMDARIGTTDDVLIGSSPDEHFRGAGCNDQTEDHRHGRW